jgi:hypothetical protein
MSTKVLSYTAAILSSFGYSSDEALLEAIDGLPRELFKPTVGVSQYTFRIQILRLVELIEQEGSIVKETKAMTREGALLESMAEDYLEIRRAYLLKRKRLKDRLEVLASLRTINTTNA